MFIYIHYLCSLISGKVCTNSQQCYTESITPGNPLEPLPSNLTELGLECIEWPSHNWETEPSTGSSMQISACQQHNICLGTWSDARLNFFQQSFWDIWIINVMVLGFQYCYELYDKLCNFKAFVHILMRKTLFPCIHI